MPYWRYVKYEFKDLTDTSMVYILSTSPLNYAYKHHTQYKM